MKYSEAEKQIKALSDKYYIYMYDGDFNVAYKENKPIAYVGGNTRYKINIFYTEEAFQKIPFSSKLYIILAELAVTPIDERVEAKKYYVKVFNNELGYLNINILTGKVTADEKSETDSIKTKLTSKTIEQLKQREDVALDWNKIHFEDAG